MSLKKSNKKYKKKNTYYDPSLKQGYDLLDNLSGQIGRTVNAQNKYAHDKSAYLPSTSGEPIITSAPPKVEDRDYGKHWYSQIPSFFRAYANELISQSVNDDEAQLDDIQQNLNAIDAVNTYRDLLNRRDQVEQEVARLEQQGRKYAAESVRRQNQDLYTKIEQYDQYFQTEGKNNPYIADLMYDKSKLSFADKARINASYIAGFDITDGKQWVNQLDDKEYLTGNGFLDRVLRPGRALAGIGSALVTAAKNTVSLVGEYADKAGNSATGLDMAGSITNKVLSTLPADDPIVQKMYRRESGSMNQNNVSDYAKLYKDDLNKQKYEKIAELGEDLYTKATGNTSLGQLIHIAQVDQWTPDFINANKGRFDEESEDSILNSKFNLWDPKDGTSGWKKDMEEQGSDPISFIKHPLVSILQTASSVGMMKHTINAMGADAIISAMSAILFRNPQAAAVRNATTASRLASTATSEKAASEFAKIANKYEKRAMHFEGAQTAATALNVGIGINAAVNSRKLETGLERISGMSQRVFAEAEAKGANMSNVFSAIAQDAIKNGYDIKDLNPEDLINLGIALDTYTGDEVYEKVKSDSRKGIMKLVNANNALAVKDYLQTLPFMSYGGRALNAFVNRIANSYPMRRAITRIAGQKTPDYLVGNGLKEIKLPGQLRVEDELQPIFSGIIDSAINKASKKFFSKDFANAVDAAANIKKGLYAKRIAQWLKPKALGMVLEGTTEGIEEGQQEILQQRYQQGLYDNYNRPYDMFNVGEMFDNVALAKEALDAYFGINGDPYLNNDNIRKAMNIGAVAALIQSGAMHSFKNINVNADDTARTLMRQMKSDKTIARLIGQQYANIDDTAHMEMFYEGIKSGRRAEDLARALFDIRANVDENNTVVKRSFVDNDITMLYNVARLMNDNHVNKFLDSKGIIKYSDDYKNYVMAGAAKLTSKDTADRLARENAQLVDDRQVRVRHNVIDQMLGILNNPQLSDVDKQSSLNTFSEQNSGYISFLNKLRAGYKKYADAYPQIYKESRENAIARVREGEKAKTSAINKQASVIGQLKRKRSKATNQEEIDKLDKQIEDARKKYQDSRANTKYLTDEEIQKKADEYLKSKNVTENPQSESDWMHNVLRAYNTWQQMLVAQKLLGISKDRKAFLNLYQSKTGLDLDTRTIGGVIDVLQKFVKDYEKTRDKFLDNDGRKHRNLDPVEFKDFFDNFDIKEDELGDSQDFEKELTGWMINRALTGPLADEAAPYTMTTANPNAIQNAVYGKENKRTEYVDDEDKRYAEELEKDTTEYGRMRSELTATSDIESEFMDREAKIHDIQQKEKEVAFKKIKHDIAELKRRKRIANQEWIEEAPVTQNVIDEAENGDQQAQAAVQRAADQAEEATTQQVQSRGSTLGESDAERASMEQYGGRNRNREQRRERQKKAWEDRLKQSGQNGESLTVETPVQDERAEAETVEAENQVSEGYEISNDKGETEPATEKPKTGGKIEPEQEKPTPRTPTSKFAQNVMQGDEAEVSGEEVENQPQNENQKPGSDDVPLPGKNDNTNTGENKTGDDAGASEVGNNEQTEDQLAEQEEREAQQQQQETTELEEAEQQIAEKEYIAQRQEEEAEQKINESWVEIDDPTLLDYDEDRKQMTYDGSTMPEDQSRQIIDDMILLQLADVSDLTQDQLPDGTTQSTPVLRVNATADSIGSLISNTFFYTIDEEERDVPMKLTVPGEDGKPKQIKLPKELGTARELAKKLTRKGWLSSARTYYVVTQSQQAADNTVTTKNPLQALKDTLTVSMIIEDDEKCYAVSLRALGITMSDIADKQEQKRVGKSKYTDNAERRLRNELYLKGISLAKVLANSDQTSLPKTYSARRKLVQKVINEMSLRAYVARATTTGNMTEEEARQYWLNRPGTKGSKYKYNTTEKNKNRNAEIARRAKDQANWSQQHRLIEYRIRELLEVPGKKILTDRQIEDQISSLRQFRNKIIDSYVKFAVNKKTGKYSVIFPGKVRTDVQPASVSQSNGRIDNQTDGVLHESRQVGNKEYNTVEEVEEDLNNGEIVLGYGHGAYGEKDTNGRAFQITAVDEKDATTTFDGKGLSGKIYWIVDGPSESVTKTPIMLQEEKFDYQERIIDGKRVRRYLNSPTSLQKNLKLCLSWRDGELHNDNKNGYIPSTAEILFYMLTRRFDFGTNDENKIDDIIEFFIHHGEKTLLANQPKIGNDPRNFLASKQLDYSVDPQTGQRTLHIGIGNSVDGYEVQNFTDYDLFENQNGAVDENQEPILDENGNQYTQSEWNRRVVVGAIATQMHWDTDLTHMRSRISLTDPNDAVGTFLRNLILKQTADKTVKTGLNSTISILGNSQLSFAVSDFFEDAGGGSLRPKKNISTLAWMLKNKKISTDTSKEIFRDPFVFADGVKETVQQTPDASAAQQAAEEKKDTAPGGIDMGHQPEPKHEGLITLDQEKVKQYDERVGDDSLIQLREAEGFRFPKNKEEHDEYLQTINEANKDESIRQKGGIVERILLTDPYTNEEYEDLFGDKNGVKKYLLDTAKKFATEWNKQESVQKIDINKIEVRGNVTQQIAMDPAAALQKGFIHIDVYGDGSSRILFKNGTTAWNSPVSGIYSTERTEGQLDEEQARDWLETHLGISRHNVVLRNSVMLSASGREVFGVTNVALDRIAGEVTGLIQLSRRGGASVTYHEAWHYVNLLMNNPFTRATIWNEYWKSHKSMFGPHVTNREIEEALAEEFRRWVVEQQDTSLSGRIKRLFNNVLDFLIVSRRRSAYRQLFRDIQNGKFAKRKLDRESITQFRVAFRDGAYYIPYDVTDVDRETLKKLHHMNTHHDLFGTLDAVVRHIITSFNIDSIETLRRISGDYAVEGEDYNGTTFQDILDEVDDMISNTSDDSYADMMRDIHDNPELIKHALAEEFNKFGVRVSWKKGQDQAAQQQAEKEESERAEKDAENGEVFSFDKMKLTVSRKENAALSTKMFFWSIPKYKSHDKRNGTKVFVPELDPWGSQLFYDFDSSWTLIQKDLWDCDSLDDVYTEDVKTTSGVIIHQKGDYKINSIFGKVQQKAQSSEFYHAVFEKLLSISSDRNPNTELRSQLFSTINSSKQQIAYMKVSDPRQNISYEEEDYDFGEEEDEDLSLNQLVNAALIRDQMRRWQINDDSLIQVERQLPRDWSKQLASNGLITYSQDKGAIVDKTFAKNREKEYGKLVNALVTLTSTINGRHVNNDNQIQQALDGKNGLKAKTVQFLNNMGIDMDIPSLNVFIEFELQRSGLNRTGRNAANRLIQLLTSTDRKLAGFGRIITQLHDAAGKSVFSEGDVKYDRELDQLYCNYQSQSFLSRLAVAYDTVHPSPSEFASRGPNGEMYYPINENSYVTDRIRNLNDRENTLTEDLLRDPYAKHSLILSTARQIDDTRPDSKFKLEAFVGMRDGNRDRGADYFGITPMEDYLSKMFMTEHDMLIFPTMADKKTWYAIRNNQLKLSHDLLVYGPSYDILIESIYEAYQQITPQPEGAALIDWRSDARKWYYGMAKTDPQAIAVMNSAITKQKTIADGGGFSNFTYHENEDGTLSISPRFGRDVLDRFAGYFLDELDAIIAYYDEDNIQRLVNDPNSLQENFHGKVKDGKMDFSGNGGKFRYFYNLGITAIDSKFDFKDKDGNQITNINQILEALYNLEQGIIKNTVKRPGEQNEGLGTATTLDNLHKNDNTDLDGFELIRQYLQQLRNQVIKNEFGGLQELDDSEGGLLDCINQSLVEQVESELKFLSQPGPLQLVYKDAATGQYINKAIPEQFFEPYVDQMKAAGYGQSSTQYTQPLLIYSLIANHVVNAITSTIEFEKVFSGDSAQYKEKNLDGVTTDITITGDVEGIEFTPFKTSVSNFGDISSDKIKRLGSLLSPGQEIRTTFSEAERKKYGLHNNDKYTVLEIEDMQASTLFEKQSRYLFSTQLLIDYIRNRHPKQFDDFVASIPDSYFKKHALTKKADTTENRAEAAIDLLYQRQHYTKLYDSLDADVKEDLQTKLDQQMGPYVRDKITVSDAQVFIRPEMYRRIRIGLGDAWSFTPDETGYSDEDAYNILENGYYIRNGKKIKVEDGAWLHDVDLAKKVAKFQAFPLKMSYFQNDSVAENTATGVFRNHTTLDKMAIFAIFKFHRSTDVGRQLYDRMNAKGNEIDMIAFKSAVKVGAHQNGANPINPNNKKVETQTSNLSEQLKVNPDGTPMYLSDKSINYNNGSENKPHTGDKTVGVAIQSMKNLRLQLNTHAHEADTRNIGTQMFKIAFSNIDERAEYGRGVEGEHPITGKAIRRDIMDCINLLTALGSHKIQRRFFKKGRVDNVAIRTWLSAIAYSQGLGTMAQNILDNGGVAASLMSRTVFENAASSYVNSNVVDIETNGGTAVQQSMFGFAAFDNKTVGTQDGNYTQYNNGEELKWNSKEGSMQVLLSINFFRQVLPKDLVGNYDASRRWLIANNIIGGESKPFGMGYRIPTQGQSSMFLMQVADVLPQQSADTIIVPREFTAQTGSDFDVDKIFIATKSFIEGKALSIDDESLNKLVKQWLTKPKAGEKRESLDIKAIAEKWCKENIDRFDERSEDDKRVLINRYDLQKAISNRLLSRYMMIIGDTRTYGASRASIDVITKKLKSKLVSKIQDGSATYTNGLSVLTPHFQALRKQEFSTGKSGIGPFALNITNLSLTQNAHLSLDYGENPWKFRNLDSIRGDDDARVADWLSAMVNAHVDVAKDPYIFTINVNQATYNHANFLLRAGKGIGTFTFLAQPILKEYANALNTAGGIYGGNLKGDATNENVQRARGRQVAKKLYTRYANRIDRILQFAEDTGYKLKDSDKKHFRDIAEYFKLLGSNDREANKKIKDAGYGRTVAEDDMFDTLEDRDGAKGRQGLDAILNDGSQDLLEQLKSVEYQLHAMQTFIEVDAYARQLSTLVRMSQIDTKKFGNTIAKQIDFTNKQDQFKYGPGDWICTDPGFTESVAAKEKTYKDRNLKVPSNLASMMALSRYFSTSYLDYKFNQAKAFTQLLLSGQVIPATYEFKNIFRYVMASRNGESELYDLNGNKHVVYGTTGVNEKTIEAVSNAIDNTLRALILTRCGYDSYEQLKDKYPDMADLTMGGDIESVRDYLKKLIFGYEEQADIFNRLRTMMKDIKANPANYIGLIDPNDKSITNELLNYLSPLTKTDKTEIGRMMLKHMQNMTSDAEKVRLQTAWSQLLQHSNEKVRNIARDLIFYAYYSGYNQNTANSFFDLVPDAYRKQYDDTLQYVIKRLDNVKDERGRAKLLIQLIGDTTITIDNVQFGEQSGQEQQSAINMESLERMLTKKVIELMSRNYWFNDNIVPTYYPSIRETSLNGYGDIMLNVFYVDGKPFPGQLISTSVPGGSDFITIKKGRTKILYRRAGIIHRIHKTERGTGDDPTYIYLPAQKLGYQSTGITWYELTQESQRGSMFEQNKLNGKLAEDIQRKVIEDYASHFNTEGSNYDQIIVSWEDEQPRELYTSTNLNVFTVPNGEEDKMISLGKIETVIDEDAEYSGAAGADVIINIVSDNIALDDQIAQYKSKSLRDKVVTIHLSDDPATVIDQIMKIADGKKDNLRIHITTNLSDRTFDKHADEKAIDEYTQQRLDEIEANATEKQLMNIDDLLQKEGERIKQYDAGYYVMQQKFNTQIATLAADLVLAGAKLQKFTTSAFRNQNGAKLRSHIAAAVNNVYNSRPNYFAERNIVYIDPSIMSNGYYKLQAFCDRINNSANTSSTSDLNAIKAADEFAKAQEVLANQTSQKKQQEQVRKIIQEVSKPTTGNKFAAGSIEEDVDEGTEPQITKQASDNKEDNTKKKKNENCSEKSTGTPDGGQKPINRFAANAVDDDEL